MIYNFFEISKNKDLIEIHNIYEKIRENQKTTIIDVKNFYDYKKNYEYVKNFQASFIKKDYCFFVFCRFFDLYKKKNINLEYNKIQSKIDFLKNDSNKHLIDCQFNDLNNKNLYNLFTILKNSK